MTITAGDIRLRLLDRYPLADGWITMGEVTPPKTDRRFDLIAIMGWQSRGHEAMGFEIKVSRSDWLRELREPAKAEPLVDMCSRWWIVAPPCVVDVQELPPAWGLFIVHPEQIRTAKQAPILTPSVWSDALWRCMLLRCATREAYAPNDIRDAHAKGWKEGNADGRRQTSEEIERERVRIKDLETIIHEAEKVTGVQLRHWCNYPALGEAMGLIKGSHNEDLARQLERKAAQLHDVAKSMRTAAKQLSKPMTAKTKIQMSEL